MINNFTQINEAVEVMTVFAAALSKNDYENIAHVLDNTVVQIYTNRKFYLKNALSSMMALIPLEEYKKVYPYIKQKFFLYDPTDK